MRGVFGAATGRPFRPNQLTGLQLWLRADTGVYTDAGTTLATNGQTVQQWNDQSGNAKNASQATSGKRPTYTTNILNGLPGVYYPTGSLTHQLTAGGNGDFADANYTIFCVYQNANDNTISSARSLLGKGDGATVSGSVWGLQAASGGGTWSYITYSGTNNQDALLQYSGSLTTPQVVTLSRVGGGAKKLYLNNLLINSDTDANTSNLGSQALGIGNVGGLTAGQQFTGYIAEIIYYSATLTTTQITQVNGYLASKYGILLNSITPKPVVSVPAGIHLWTVNVNGGGPPANMYVYTSTDAVNFTNPVGVTNPVFVFKTTAFGNSDDTQICNVIFYNNTYWATYEVNDNDGNVAVCGVASAPAPGGPWTYIADVTLIAAPVGLSQVYNPQWLVDNSGNVYIIATVTNNTAGATFTLASAKASNPGTFTSWAAPAAVTGTSIPVNAGTGNEFVIPASLSPNGLYTIWIANANWPDWGISAYGYMQSSSPVSGYNTSVALPTMGLGAGALALEAPTLIKLSDRWRLYTSSTGISSAHPFYYTDSFDNWASWTPFSFATSSHISTPQNSNGTGHFTLY